MSTEPPPAEGPGPPPAEPPPAEGPGPPPAQPPPPAPPPPLPPRVAAAGWTTAALQGVLAFVIVLLVAAIVVVLSAIKSDLSAVQVAKLSALLFFGFHHVGVEARVPDFDLGSILGQVPGQDLAQDLPFDLLGGISISVTLAVAVLAGTALALWLLLRAGRLAAEAGGGPLWGRAAVGAFAAVPYAALSLALALLVELRFEIPDPAPLDALHVSPSPVAALLWPLLLGGAFGALGGLSTAREEIRGRGRGPALLAAAGGGARMLWYALGIAFVGLLVLAGTNPEVTREYFSGVAEAGALEGSLILLYTAILAAPLMMVAGLFGGMGTPIVLGEYAGTNSATLLSLWEFPEGLGPGFPALAELDPLQTAVQGTPGGVPFETGIAPPEYFFFVLAPLVAVIAGGRWAARRAGALTAGEGAAAGAWAGAIFGAGAILLAILGGVGFRADVQFGLSQSVLGRMGPHLLFGTTWALVWGLGGGALGGLLGAGRGSPRPAGFSPEEPSPGRT